MVVLPTKFFRVPQNIRIPRQLFLIYHAITVFLVIFVLVYMIHNKYMLVNIPLFRDCEQLRGGCMELSKIKYYSASFSEVPNARPICYVILDHTRVDYKAFEHNRVLFPNFLVFTDNSTRFLHSFPSIPRHFVFNIDVPALFAKHNLSIIYHDLQTHSWKYPDFYHLQLQNVLPLLVALERDCIYVDPSLRLNNLISHNHFVELITTQFGGFSGVGNAFFYLHQDYLSDLIANLHIFYDFYCPRCSGTVLFSKYFYKRCHLQRLQCPIFLPSLDLVPGTDLEHDFAVLSLSNHMRVE